MFCKPNKTELKSENKWKALPSGSAGIASQILCTMWKYFPLSPLSVSSPSVKIYIKQEHLKCKTPHETYLVWHHWKAWQIWGVVQSPRLWPGPTARSLRAISGVSLQGWTYRRGSISERKHQKIRSHNWQSGFEWEALLSEGLKQSVWTLNCCPSHTEIFSKRRKIYPVCAKNLSCWL